MIDQAIGEAPALRFRPRSLQAATDGLFAALSAWRSIANHREGRADAQSGDGLAALLGCVPPLLRETPAAPAVWAGGASGLRRACSDAVRRLAAFPARTPAQRLLALTLRDLRCLAAGRRSWSALHWEGHVYGRLSAMPAGAEPLQRAQLAAALAAALAVGAEVIRLQRQRRRLPDGADLDETFSALARGDSAAAVERLGHSGAALAALSASAPGAGPRLRLRATLAALSETLAQHAAYFDAGTSP